MTTNKFKKWAATQLSVLMGVDHNKLFTRLFFYKAVTPQFCKPGSGSEKKEWGSRVLRFYNVICIIITREFVVMSSIVYIEASQPE